MATYIKNNPLKLLLSLLVVLTIIISSGWPPAWADNPDDDEPNVNLKPCAQCGTNTDPQTHTPAPCGEHNLCDSGDHSVCSCGKGYNCQSGHGAAKCGITGHKECDGLDHSKNFCGHYHCEGHREGAKFSKPCSATIVSVTADTSGAQMSVNNVDTGAVYKTCTSGCDNQIDSTHNLSYRMMATGPVTNSGVWQSGKSISYTPTGKGFVRISAQVICAAGGCFKDQVKIIDTDWAEVFVGVNDQNTGGGGGDGDGDGGTNPESPDDDTITIEESRKGRPDRPQGPPGEPTIPPSEDQVYGNNTSDAVKVYLSARFEGGFTLSGEGLPSSISGDNIDVYLKEGKYTVSIHGVYDESPMVIRKSSNGINIDDDVSGN